LASSTVWKSKRIEIQSKFGLFKWCGHRRCVHVRRVNALHVRRINALHTSRQYDECYRKISL
jgi:hypothetical protein